MNQSMEINTSTYHYHYLNVKRKCESPNGFPTLEQIKAEYIDYVLELASNDLDKTEKILNISPDNLFKQLRKIHFRI